MDTVVQRFVLFIGFFQFLSIFRRLFIRRSERSDYGEFFKVFFSDCAVIRHLLVSVLRSP